MGANKATMVFAGEPLLIRALRRLSPAVDDTMVIGPETLRALAPDIRVVPDLVPGAGPLCGLYTALKSTTAARVFLVACDMPFIQPGLVRAMLAASAANQEAQAVMLSDQGHGQPLHAVYAHTCLPMVERALASEDHSLRSLLARLSAMTMDAEIVRREDPRGIATYNVNTPDDWRSALRLAAELASSSDG
jgi:molybdopterin-guanine dinucleotide biosynthesis protein A